MNSANNIWKTSNKILLVLNYSNIEELKRYREGIKDLGLNIHNCSILAIVETKKEKMLLSEASSLTYCSPQEINFLGKMKNDLANKVLGEKYDMIIIIGDLKKKIAKIVKKVSAKYAVGLNSNVEFLTINLSSNSTSPAHLLNFVKQTVEKIN